MKNLCEMFNEENFYVNPFDDIEEDVVDYLEEVQEFETLRDFNHLQSDNFVAVAARYCCRYSIDS